MKKILVTLAALSGFFIAQNVFATCSNYTTYTSGQTLTSSSLNSLQSNYTNCINEILNGDIFTGNMYWYSGSSLFMYSDTGSTLKFGADGTTGNVTTEGQINLGTGGVVLNDDGDGALTITGAGNGSDEDLTLNLDDTSNTAVISSSTGVTALGMNGVGMNVYSDSGSTLKAKIEASSGAAILGLTQAGQVTNCGISVSGSTFTIAGYDGTALSATNPCVVAVRSNTAGRVALAYFTANVTFTFGATSDTDGNLFGITDANWSSAMPFFIGVIYNGTTPYFTISRVPISSAGLADTDLCQKGDTDCDSKADVMLLTTGQTLSGFVELPITQVGWVQSTYATTGGAWSYSVPVGAGFNEEYEKKIFTFPTGQMGAASGMYMADNSGTAPDFGFASVYYYTINKEGWVKLQIDLYNDGGTDGSGAVSAALSMPYATPSAVTVYMAYLDVLTPSSEYDCQGVASGNSSLLFLRCPTVSGSALQSSKAYLQNSAFSNGSRNISGTIIYRAINQ